MRDNLTALSDEGLMAEYQSGNEWAFEELYGRHSGKVYGFLLNKTGDRMVADEVFQATFLKLHRARFQYNPHFPFLPWLFTVCKRVMIDHLRKQKTFREILDSEAQEKSSALVTEERSASLLAPHLAKLSGPQKEALEMRYLKEMSFDEIAQRLDKTPANVRQLVSRAVKKLRDLLSGEASQ